MKPENLDELLQDTYAYADAIEAERKTREGGRHTNDHRIATESAERLFWLGRHADALRKQNEHIRASIEVNNAKIRQLSGLYLRLRSELENATCGDLVVRE